MAAVVEAVTLVTLSAAAALAAPDESAVAAAAAGSGTIAHDTGIFAEGQSDAGIAVSHTAAEKTVPQAGTGSAQHLPGSAAGRTESVIAVRAVSQTVACRA